MANSDKYMRTNTPNYKTFITFILTGTIQFNIYSSPNILGLFQK